MGERRVRILDIGCGTNKTYGSIGMDIVDNPNVDIIQDITKTPWKMLRKDSFDMVIANNILEHIEHNKEFFNVMKEVHRILKPKGIFKIEVPYYKGRFSCCNPEHTRYFQSDYFNYFEKDFTDNQTHLSNKSGVYFKVIKQELCWTCKTKFLNFLKPLYNIYFPITELFLSNILPPDVLKVELRATK